MKDPITKLVDSVNNLFVCCGIQRSIERMDVISQHDLERISKVITILHDNNPLYAVLCDDETFMKCCGADASLAMKRAIFLAELQNKPIKRFLCMEDWRLR